MFTGFLVYFLGNYMKFRSKVQAPRIKYQETESMLMKNKG